MILSSSSWASIELYYLWSSLLVFKDSSSTFFSPQKSFSCANCEFTHREGVESERLGGRGRCLFWVLYTGDFWWSFLKLVFVIELKKGATSISSSHAVVKAQIMSLSQKWQQLIPDNDLLMFALGTFMPVTLISLTSVDGWFSCWIFMLRPCLLFVWRAAWRWSNCFIVNHVITPKYTFL